MRNPRRDWPHDVYRAYGHDGQLLYVGMSVNAFRRLRQHKQDSSWAPYAKSLDIRRYKDKATAAYMEARAIQTEHPIWNVRLEFPAIYRGQPDDPIETISDIWPADVWGDSHV